MYSTILTNIVNNIYKTEGEKQKNLLKYFCNNLRYCKLETLIKYKAFIVISNDYLKRFDKDLEDYPNLNIYIQGKCKLYSRLIIPIWGFDNKVHSFLIFDDGRRENGIILGKDQYIAYETLNNKDFEKGKYWLMYPNLFKEAFNKKYICIVDGTFDAINLNTLEIPTVALLSSNLTKYHREYLKFIPNWIIVADNDRAGKELFEYSRKFNNHCVRLIFNNKYKDIDDYIKNNINLENEENIKNNEIINTINKIKSTGFLLNMEMGV